MNSAIASAPRSKSSASSCDGGFGPDTKVLRYVLLMLALISGGVAFLFYHYRNDADAGQNYTDYPMKVCWLGLYNYCTACDGTDDYFRSETIVKYYSPENATQIITLRTCVDYSCMAAVTSDQKRINADFRRYDVYKVYTGRINKKNDLEAFLSTDYYRRMKSTAVGFFVVFLVLIALIFIGPWLLATMKRSAYHKF